MRTVEFTTSLLLVVLLDELYIARLAHFSDGTSLAVAIINFTRSEVQQSAPCSNFTRSNGSRSDTWLQGYLLVIHVRRFTVRDNGLLFLFIIIRDCIRELRTSPHLVT